MNKSCDFIKSPPNDKTADLHMCLSGLRSLFNRFRPASAKHNDKALSTSPPPPTRKSQVTSIAVNAIYRNEELEPVSQMTNSTASYEPNIPVHSDLSAILDKNMRRKNQITLPPLSNPPILPSPFDLSQR